ncbi:16S rRNA (cytidine(1402)-2'-O)-methyltransferase [Alicyclobacillus mengziensis]|uniref:16S rRNA (cytidine(1402)-2'-O)-methyltransferase n=1 Tax=Alicyclobacillus mengziensis TaxID=2931921 RepID=UPI0020131BB5|nr:16S rRNA (cytidine(1402)-2'-O)-methyltransferase [Alicyclobacillus mengziensis]
MGNLDDVTPRLIEILRTVDVVAAEDTRQTRKLLTRYDIHVPELVSYHEHNAVYRRDWLQTLWKLGKRVALVSDAGTPIVSDPGDDAVQLAIEAGVPVVPIPGPSAVLAALVSSGLPAIPFTFVGFLPRGAKESREALDRFGKLSWTFIFYEAPHRLQKTLSQLATLWPERQITLAKELTKRHETLVYGTAVEVHDFIAKESPRGEYVVVVGPASETEKCVDLATCRADDGDALSLQEAVQMVRRLMGQGVSHKEAVKKVAEENGLRRKDLYDSTL